MSFPPVVDGALVIRRAVIGLAAACIAPAIVAGAHNPSPEADGAKGGARSEWGVARRGVRTRLSPVDTSFTLGQPMRFRLEMENVGRSAVRFDSQQVDVNGSLAIDGPGGARAPFIVATVQTVGAPRPLGPGEKVVLFEGLDIAEQYLITAPGRYVVRFRGRDEAFGEIPLPPSNEVIIRVHDGPVPVSRLVARRLLEVERGSSWRIEILEEGQVVPLGRSAVQGTAFALKPFGGAKEDAMRVRIWVTADPAPVAAGAADGSRGLVAEDLGRSRWGHAYLWSPAGDAAEGTPLRISIGAALELENRAGGRDVNQGRRAPG